MKIQIKRVKKGDHISLQVKGGYIPAVAPERGYIVKLGEVGAYIPDSLLKEARADGAAFSGES
jgi:hypothetical protein